MAPDRDLVGFTLGNVAIQLEWIDGRNAIQQRVRYTVTTTYRPIVTYFFQQRDVYAPRRFDHANCSRESKEQYETRF